MSTQAATSCLTCARHDPHGGIELAAKECYSCRNSRGRLTQWTPIAMPLPQAPCGGSIPSATPECVAVGGGAIGTTVATPMPPRPAYYTALAITPFEYAMRNKLDAMQFSVVKYVTRFRDKGGVKDLRKAQDCLEQLIKHEEANAKQAK